MKNLSFFVILLFLIFSGTAVVNAQVRIGGNMAPQSAAVLDLNVDSINTTVGTKGLALPRVSLASATDKMGNANIATGMLVYNTGGALGVGVYSWDGSSWRRTDGNLRITTQPAPFTFRRLQDVNGDPNGPATATAVTLSVTASGSGTLTYAWYAKPRNVNSTVRGAALATTATFTPSVTAWGMNSYYCVVKNGTDSVVSNVADVAVGCGAKTSDGGWTRFMCQNLGASAAPAGSLDGITFSTNVPAAGADTISTDAKGWLYQWGRVADGHQWRGASQIAIASTATLAAGGSQFAAGQAGYGQFIVGDATINQYDWRRNQWDMLWRHWTDQSNVCPSGWYVPTSDNWSSIFVGAATVAAPGNATANTWFWTGNGYAIRPDGVTTTLFLPAAGLRFADYGAFSTVGTIGHYWSSTTSSSLAYTLLFNSTLVSPAIQSTRGAGFSVRCVQN